MANDLINHNFLIPSTENDNVPSHNFLYEKRKILETNVNEKRHVYPTNRQLGPHTKSFCLDSLLNKT